jgi:hypothetical protein
MKRRPTRLFASTRPARVGSASTLGCSRRTKARTARCHEAVQRAGAQPLAAVFVGGLGAGRFRFRRGAFRFRRRPFRFRRGALRFAAFAGAAGRLAFAGPVGLALRCGSAHRDLLIPLGPRRCGADTDVLALAANQSERNQGQSRAIAAYLAPIRQFLPDRERILGLGLNGGREGETSDMRGISIRKRGEIQTESRRHHNQELYQLSYVHRVAPM